MKVFIVFIVLTTIGLSFNNVVAEDPCEPYTDPECGDATGNYWCPIGEFRSIIAYSNGNWTGNGNCGQFQCVEYVRRVYQHEVLNTLGSLGSEGWAVEAFDSWHNNSNLEQYIDGETMIPPEPGDIYCQSGSTFGHVAIIKNVDHSTNQVIIVDQNRSMSDAELQRELFVDEQGRYSIQAIGESFTTQGWLRDPDYNQSLIFTAFLDDFEDGDDIGWMKRGYGNWTVENGMYVFDVSSPNGHGESVIGNPNWTDYTIEVDIRGVHGIDKQIYFREVEHGDTYILLFRSEPYSEIVIYKYIDFEGEQLTSNQVSFDIDNGQWYKLLVSAVDDRIQAFVNGEQVIDYIDTGTTLTHGRIGIGGYISSGQLLTEFDNIKVTGPPDILPSIYITSPNDGGFLRGGSPAGINWQCWGPNVDHIRIQYSDDNGATFSDQAYVGNSGHYDWDVPSAVVQNAIIRVQAESADNSILASDQSDKSFPILRTYTAFSDDFEDDNSDVWETNGDGAWTESEGVYTFTCSGFPASGKSLTGNTEWTDYVFEADVQGVTGINKYLWIREEHACNTYTTVLLSEPYSQILFLKYIDCVEQFRIEHTLPFTVVNGEIYHMTVAAIEDRFQVFVNNHLAIDFVDGGTEIRNGRVGLGGYVFNGTSETDFDNVIVWGNVNALLLETEELLPESYDIDIAEADDINTSETVIREILIDYVSRTLLAILNWPGSELMLSVRRPDGSLFNEWQSTEPPIIAEFTPDTTGTWQVEVNAIDIPYDDYPYALVVGTNTNDWICGDVNGDGEQNLLDILHLIAYLYNDPPGPEPISPESGDVNADGVINLLDILYLISYIYGEPPGPNPVCQE